MLGMQVLENKIAYFHLKHHPVSVSYGYSSILVILRELRSRDLQYYTAWFYWNMTDLLFDNTGILNQIS